MKGVQLENPHAAELSSHLEHFRLRYDNGDKAALLEAVEFCGLFRLVMPQWVSYWFAMSHRKWTRLKVKTLDEAFDVQKKKGFHLAKEHQFLQKSFDVYMSLLAAERKGKSISIGKNGAIEDVAEEFGLNRQKVWDMYNHVRRNTLLGRGFEETREKR